MVRIAPMSEEYIHIHCLHRGPVNPQAPPAGDRDAVQEVDLPLHPWSDAQIVEIARTSGIEVSHGWRGEAAREFMREMIRRYGTCAMLAWEEETVVGQLRFYPCHITALLEQAGVYPPMPWETEEPERTLRVHCVMTTRPFTSDTEGRAQGARRGVGQQLAQALIEWARGKGWALVEAQAHPDLDFLYGHESCSGRRFWLKAGFRARSTWRKPLSSYPDKIRGMLEREIAAKGMSEAEAETWYRMARRL